MKLTSLLLFWACLHVSAASHSQTVTLKVDKQPLPEVLTYIKEQTGYLILYNDRYVSPDMLVSIDAVGQPLEDVLGQLLRPQQLTYYIKDKTIAIRQLETERPIEKHSGMVHHQQQQFVTGRVTDESGGPVPGVTVLLKGTKTGTVTSVDGFYRLPVRATNEKTVISFSFVGFEQQEIEVGTSNRIDVVLKQADVALREVVVTALGIAREVKSLPYARQSVSTEEMTEARSTNFISALSGKAAGVQVVNNSTPNGSNRVIIRGLTSVTGNNQPLYVVDGAPVDASQGDGGVTVWDQGDDIDYGNPLSSLNPDDIESIEILKGPNAAALYGSRAANGVVLITTKVGKNKKGLGISVNSNTSFTSNAEYPYYQYVYGPGDNGRLVVNANNIDGESGLPMVGAHQRAMGAPMLGQKVISYNGVEMPLLPKPGNIKQLYQTGATYTNGVTMGHANENRSFRLSYTNTQSEFTMKDFEVLRRHNLTFRGKQDITKTLWADASILYTGNHVKNRLYRNGSERNPANNYMFMRPDMDIHNLMPYKDENGYAFRYNGPFNNPFWNIYENSNQDESDRIIGNITLQWQIIKGLRLRGKVMGDLNAVTADEFNNMGAAYDIDGYYRAFDNRTQNWNYEALLTYNKRFSKLSLVAMLGANRFDFKRSLRESRIGSLLIQDVKSLANSSTFPIVKEVDAEKRINSVFGSFSFGYDDVIYMDVTARNDWSSTLPAKNNAYFYPSVGTSFLFSELVPKNKVLTFGKLRASYAQVGNDTDPYNVLTTYNYGGIYNGIPWTSLQDTRNNPELKPELTSSWEYGLEASFLKSRLSLNATYYNSSTINQIIPAQTTPTSGFNRQFVNAGEIQSEGWELFLSGKPLTGKIKWNIDVNWSKNESLVVSLVEGVDRLLLRQWFDIYVYAEVGQPLGMLRGSVQARDPETGVPLVLGNGRVAWVDDQILGNAQPDWIGSLRNAFSYKGFSVSALLDVKKGGDVFSGTMVKAMNMGMRGETYPGRDEWFFSHAVLGENNNERMGVGLFGHDYADSERPKGTRYEGAAIAETGEDGNYVAQRDENGDIVYSAVWLNPKQKAWDPLQDKEQVTYDASYVKLRELVVGYDLPKNILKNTPLQSARVSVVGRNLWTIHDNMPQGLDPEANTTSGNGQGIEYASFLPTRTLGFNIKLTF